jgi:hypothetical protein
MNAYDKGDLVRVTATFTNSAGAATDPTAVTCRVKSPTATTVYVYGTDAALVKDATGVFHLDVSAATAGQWYYRWEGTGAVEQADEGAFVVTASAFD